ncbi:MAG: FAD:protein FMN transferase [Lachnospiraceae bacterium]|nr:FAD:protein FMN transferase [Lachnospiraceae bacterium]
MDTYFGLKAYGQNGEAGLTLCEERVRELEAVLSVTAEGSDVWRIDHEHRVSVSEDTFVLIREALQVCEQTDGALDITLYPVLWEWGFTTGEYRIPDRGVLDGLLKAVDYQRVELEEQTRLVTVPAEAQIDLGAVAKGYTGDALIEVLRQQGVTSAILDLGGNVQTLGVKPDGTPWRVAVRDPFDKSQVAGVLEINDKCVITSGGYERYFTGEDGQIYWHILDSADGEPAHNGLVSVTVVGERGVRCDALSTALFVMGKEKAAAFWRQQRDFDMILVTEGGDLILTEGLRDCFESAAGWAERVAYIH